MKNKFKKKYDKLLKIYDEISYVLADTLDTNSHIENENYYLSQFISFKGLDDEYQYFKENAHEADDPDNPFPPLIL